MLSIFPRLVQSHSWVSGFSQSPNCCLPACGFALGWLYGPLAAAVSQCQTPGSDDFPAESRKHLACSSAFVLFFFFFFFFSLTCCRWPCRTCALLCSLPTLKSQAQETSGCSRAAWGILLADYLRFILLHSGTKPWKKSHLTSLGSTDPHHPSLSALEMQAIPPLSAQVSSCCLHHLGAGFSGQGEFIRFAFPLLIALPFMSPGRRTVSH